MGKAKETMELQEAENDSDSEDRIWVQINKRALTLFRFQISL